VRTDLVLLFAKPWVQLIATLGPGLVACVIGCVAADKLAKRKWDKIRDVLYDAQLDQLIITPSRHTGIVSIPLPLAHECLQFPGSFLGEGRHPVVVRTKEGWEGVFETTERGASSLRARLAEAFFKQPLQVECEQIGFVRRRPCLITVTSHSVCMKSGTETRGLEPSEFGKICLKEKADKKTQFWFQQVPCLLERLANPQPSFCEQARDALLSRNWALLLKAAGDWIRQTPDSPAPYFFRLLALAGSHQVAKSFKEGNPLRTRYLDKTDVVAGWLDAWMIEAQTGREILHLARGMLCGGKGRLVEEQEEFLTALDIAPNEPECHLWLGLHYRGMRMAELARKSIERALDINPHHVGALYHLAICSRGNASEEEELYRKALQVEPQFFDALLDLAALLATVGRPEEGLQLALRATEIEPSLGVAHLAAGACYQALGHRNNAETWVKRACELEPEGEVGVRARRMLAHLIAKPLSVPENDPGF